MKARRKSDGKIIEVETYMLNSRRGKDGSWESSYKDINSGLVYEASELLFNLDYYTVISGWVARDVNGDMYFYDRKPIRDNEDKEFVEQCGDAWFLHEGLDIPDLTWDSAPEEVEIIIKRKKNG